MDIFGSDPGTVVLADVSNGTPMNLYLSDWGGYFDFRSIITAFRYETQGGVQFMHTLADFIYVYTFGERMGTLVFSGLSFYQACQAFNFAVADPTQAERLAGRPDHGLEEIVGYYGWNRVDTRAAPVIAVLGTSVVLESFLTGMRIGLADTEQVVGTFELMFKTVPA